MWPRDSGLPVSPASSLIVVLVAGVGFHLENSEWIGWVNGSTDGFSYRDVGIQFARIIRKWPVFFSLSLGSLFCHAN